MRLLNPLIALLALTQVALAQPWEAMTDTSIDMRPMFYPCKNQIFRGSCGTFACIGAMEFYPGVPRLSEAYVYSLVKKEALNPDGATLELMKEFLDTHGIVAEEKLPYELVGVYEFDAKNADELAIGRAFNLKRARQAAILEDYAIYHARGVKVFQKPDITWDWIEKTLRTGKPIVFGFRMNGEHWSSCRNGNIHTAEYADAEGKKKKFSDNGGHAVLAVGYRKIYDPDDMDKPEDKRGVINQICIRNSWGLQWGSQGYGWISWETYAKDHIRGALTIDSVETVTSRNDQNPTLELRAQGTKFKADDYGVTLSCVVKSPFLPEGGIKSVEYTLYEGSAKMNPEFEKFPLQTRECTKADNGFMESFYGFSHSSLNVKMVVTYKLGGKSTQWYPVPEFVTWSPEPDVDVTRVK